jgi:SAM-dependent methyltransferase
MRPRTLEQFLFEIRLLYPLNIANRLIRIMAYISNNIPDNSTDKLKKEYIKLKNTNITGSDYISESLFGPLNRHVVQKVMSILKPRDVILDLGCEQGFITAMIGHHASSVTLVGVDLCQEAIKAARSRPELPSCISFLIKDVKHYQGTANVVVAARFFGDIGGNPIGALPVIVDTRKLLKKNSVLAVFEILKMDSYEIDAWVYQFQLAGFKPIEKPEVKVIKQFSQEVKTVCYLLSKK